MDRKSIAVIVACVAALILWQFVIVPKYLPSRPIPHAATNAQNSAQSPVGTNAVTGSNNVAAPATTSAGPSPQLEVNTNLSEQLVIVTNENARYTFTSYGGGLKLIELLHYPETVPSWRNKKAQAGGIASLNTYTPSPTLAILGGAAVQGDGIFNLIRTTTGVRAEKTLTNGLIIVKDFAPTTNFLVNATVYLQNKSAQPLSLPEQEWTIGTATPMNPDDPGGPYLGLIWSDDHTHDTLGASYFSSRGFGCVPKTPAVEYRATQTNINWAAVHNQYFALAIDPKDNPAGVVMRQVNLPPPADQDIKV
ncbi:MAG TPA: membrane protein insertase YidC, partial [Verrucomicrobiaceae bacterium]